MRHVLDVVGRKPPEVVFEQLASEDQASMLCGNARQIHDFRLDVVEGVVWRNIEIDCLPVKGFHEDLPTSRPKKWHASARMLEPSLPRPLEPRL